MRSFDGPLSTQLSGIAERAQREKKRRFDNLFALITPDVLFWSFNQLRRMAAVGVDGVTWEAYGENLRTNILQLHERLVGQVYRAPNVRRVYIPKANGKQRPLGIPALEDKIVQRSVAYILEAIYETDFLPISYGYRRGIGAHDAHQDLSAEFHNGIYGYVVEADIKGFFDALDHDWLIRMLCERVDDPRLTRLIRKWLKAGIMETDGQVIHPATGTPQGGIISPLLANVYLHYVLDLWFTKVFKRKSPGRCFLMRYADDYVAGFQYKSDAQEFMREMPERLQKFHLSVEPTKTGMRRFSRHDVSGSKSFDFLGFTFRWKYDRHGRPHVGRETAKKKFAASLQGFTAWIRRARSWPRRMLFASLKRKLTGYANYYGVPGNSHKLQAMWYQLYLLLFKGASGV